MSGGGGTTQTVQKSDPWSGVQPYLIGGGVGGGTGGSYSAPTQTSSFGDPFFDTVAAFHGGGGLTIPGSYTPATGGGVVGGGGLYGRTDALSRQGQNPLVTQAQNMMLASANDPNSVYGQGQNVFNKTVRGDYLDPSTNTAFMGGLNDVLGLAKSQIAGQYGGFGGSNLLNSGYQENLARGLGGVASNAYSNLYNTERQNQMGALAQIPMMGNLAANQIGQVGQQRQDFDWSQLQKANQIFSGAQGGTTTGTQPYHDNSAAQMAGLAMMAMAAFSDRRLKTNIKRIGTHKLGVGVYRYEIFGREETGVMADEVEKVMPDAVVTMPNGYLGVRYDMIGGRYGV